MGNADLRDLASIREVQYSDLDGRLVAVDAHNWLYRYLTTTVKFTDESVYTTESGDEVANLIGIVQGLPKFVEHDLLPIFVFDGGVTELKSDEVERRREKRESAQERLDEARERGDAIEAARMEARTQRLTAVIQETTRGLFDRLDVPYVEAPAEGEAQCAHMARIGDVDYAGSEDYDTLLFGAPLTLRQLTSSGPPELMDLEATLADLDVTFEQLIDIAILCGTDFNEGISGIGPKTALKAVREHGDLWGVLDDRDEHIPHADRIRELYRNPPVADDPDYETTIEPDFPAAKRYVTEKWEIPADSVARGFERLENSLTQTGLDRWT